MSEHIGKGITAKHFEFHEDLRAFMEERLNLDKKIDKLHAAGKDLPKNLRSQDDSLGSRKVRILDEYVFQPMANLFYFFMMVSEHPELQERFENDIKDLLGVRRLNPGREQYGYVFIRLIESILLIKPKERSLNEGDFRLILLHILQEIVILGIQKSLPPILKDRQRFGMMLEDITRAAGWTSMLAFPVKDEYDLDNKGRYEKDIKHKSPHRIFPFINEPPNNKTE
jgi:hypothetical protein